MRFYSQEELKALSDREAERYLAGIRRLLVKTVGENGGHLASNLGVAEISLALGRCLDFSCDRVIYDTGHQCYVHKIITDRGDRFSTLRRLGGISGFPRREESVFDAFGTGHSGTGLSAALGFSAADRLQGKKGWNVVVLGDGAFTGGMVFEALNNVSAKDRVILILNDNGMSIGKSVGRFSGALNKMRTAGYYRFKDGVEKTLHLVPSLAAAAKKVKDRVKFSTLPTGNLFEQMGLHYFGPADGNHLPTVEFLLREAMKKDRPAVIHLCTQKGKGDPRAEEDPSRFHGVSPAGGKAGGGKSYSALFGEALCRLAEEDPRIVAVTAAMGDGVGLSPFERAYPKRYFDVGIAEEHALTFSAGLAAGGMKPCFAVYSTFFQRAYDQLLHDAALQGLPLVLCLDRAGLSGEDGATHHGVFDLPLVLSVPEVKVYAPLLEEEMTLFLKRAFEEDKCPSVIRYPKDRTEPRLSRIFTAGRDYEAVDFDLDPKLAIVTFGRTVKTALAAAEALKEKGIPVRVIRFGVLKGFSREGLSHLFHGINRLLFVEEGILAGGFSQYLQGVLLQEGIEISHGTLAIEERFVPHGTTEELIHMVGLDKESIIKEVENHAKA